MTEQLRVEGVHPPEAGKAIRISAGITPVAVFNIGGKYFAVDARCTHVGGPLDQGVVDGVTVRCPLHGSVFRLDTGAVVKGPAARPVQAYHVRFEGGAAILDPVH